MDFDEEDLALEIDERIKAPLEWVTSKKFKITDLKEPLYSDALRLIKRHFFREDPLCKTTDFLQDQWSVNEYLAFIETWINDTTSLVATSLASGRVVGVAIMRIDDENEKTNVYSRVQNVEGETLSKIMHLKHTLIKQTNPHEKFGHDQYVTIYILQVHPSYQQKGVEVALLNSCIEAAVTLKMPAIGGIFTSGNGQTKAESVGFRILSEIRYNEWVINDRIVFNDPGRGNYSIAFMGKTIPIEEEESNEDQTSAVVDTVSMGTKSHRSASEESEEIK